MGASHTTSPTRCSTCFSIPSPSFVALALAATWAWLGGLLVAGLLGLAVWQGLLERPASFISESLYRAGLWAKATLPNGCVDYVIDDWQKAYWLHVHVLGQPRGAPRGEAIALSLGQPRGGMARWQKSPNLPYAIVDNWQSMPNEARSTLTVLYRAGPTAVVHGEGTCNDATLPFDQITVPARRPLLRAPFGGTP